LYAYLTLSFHPGCKFRKLQPCLIRISEACLAFFDFEVQSAVCTTNFNGNGNMPRITAGKPAVTESQICKKKNPAVMTVTESNVAVSPR